MLIPKKVIVDLIQSKLDINKKKEEENKKELSIVDTWEELLRNSNYYTPPVFIKIGRLGNDLLNIAITKASIQIAGQTGHNTQFVQRSLWYMLKGNRHYNKNAEMSVKFLRDYNSDDFAFCPECEEENEIGWAKCAECGYDKE